MRAILNLAYAYCLFLSIPQNFLFFRVFFNAQAWDHGRSIRSFSSWLKDRTAPPTPM